MEAPPLLPGRRGPPGAAEPGEPPRKRVCKLLETLPNEADAHLIDCAMELDSKQKLSSGCGPWDAKTKPNSMVFENQGSRGTAQPCPRCIAGESNYSANIRVCNTLVYCYPLNFGKLSPLSCNGHFNHILGF